MSLKTSIQEEIKIAMKARDSLKTDCLRMLVSEIKKREIDTRAELSDQETLKIIQTLIKQRQDSIEAFTKGGRQDLADKEAAEAALLKAYLPEQMSQAAIEILVVKAIEETQAKGPSDIGKIMKHVLGASKGTADGKLVNELARTKLAAL